MAQNQKSDATRPWLGGASAGPSAVLGPVGTERLLLFLSAVFVMTGWVQLALVQLLPPATGLLAFMVWAGSFTAAHGVLNRRLPGRDPVLLPVVALLSGWGLIEIARLAPPFLNRQIVWLPISLGVFLAVAALPRDLRWLRRYRYTWLLAGLALLGATLVFGVNPSGANVERLWLRLGPIFLQPSELFKLLFVAYVSSYLAEKRDLIMATGPRFGAIRWPALPYLTPLLLMWGLAMLLLASQQDMGAALLFFLTFLVMLYIASGQAGYILAGLSLFLVGAGVAYRLISRVALRVDIWWDPWSEASGRAFQIVQSLIAFGAGGLLGQGLGQGTPTVIPVVHSDFVFAAIGEEFGLMGTLAVIALFAVLMLRGFRAALRARSPFARLLGAGLSALIGLQAWVIMAGNARLIPLTGITLPFLSYGGSSLLTSLVALGLLAQISDRSLSYE